VHARGQVLAEMGRYYEAIEQLDLALSYPRSTLSAAIAHSARAFAIGMLGDLDEALNEFGTAERVMPDSGWLHYWRGLCLIQHGRDEEAQHQLRAALDARMPPVNRPKREHADRLLARPRSLPF
jgi:tetratricopeptide (TPR) repeat protein